MLKFIKNIFKDSNTRELEKLQHIVDEINSLEPYMKKLSDEQLRDKTREFKERIVKGETLDELLPEAFAVVREAAQRSTSEKFRHYDVQLMGGIVLHQGKIAEMKTGEGKTLAATLPVYLNALTGKGVHVVTVNDYLAKRDSEWMGQIYRFLGLSVGVILNGMTPRERKKAYQADVTYGSNNEFGFDYLRDNLAYNPDDVVQGELHYAILDEVDSILIDEARTPLIISGPAQETTKDYRKFNRIIPRLVKGRDYEVDEKNRTVHLTEEGLARVEKKLNISNLYDDQNFQLAHQLNQALKAHTLMKKDRDYIVKDGEVKIVDEFTGRIMEGRRFSEGLHQAIEAKEGVAVNKESQTFASITYQNFFRMYDKLAGMTGTAATEEEEFIKIYGMEVVQIPTNKPMIREDLPDVVFRTEEAKFKAVAEEVALKYKKGQPVLVGTVDIEKSEKLSRMLKRKGIPHQVLNAKNHEKEAEIIKKAGQKNSVTISTNMAGRGTDIVLGEGVKELGGLHVIGTERHESRRIDNQLRGRSGRQGDPGSSQFFVSLEDDLLRLFGSDNISMLMDRMGFDDDQPIEHKMITRSLERAQKKVEGRNFEIRKTILEYDNIMNKQREIIYEQRKKILFASDLKEYIMGMIEMLVDDIMDTYLSSEVHPDDWDIDGLIKYLSEFNLVNINEEDFKDKDREKIREELIKIATKTYEEKEAEIGKESMQKLIKNLALRIIDRNWMNHLDNMDELRQGIGLRAYGQRDPLTEYKFESYDMFNGMTGTIREEIIKNLFRIEVKEREINLDPIMLKRLKYRRNFLSNRANRPQKKAKRQPIVKPDKPGRNDPCPCGSGKKYKHCCGR
ncbi:preprotein translocase subunit SecA [Halothermothrix orenii]|uniref:Protein translocase subunit SecA n=1 Tax=Halothermothrix orenii (strain H 168 / OCM 544 / DSM 9562) TaxID=373903 RepID=SECA_HALOH|nr:preprotein translocase subunit SecA [Halothermothrix orenii]B8CYM4.1 RecName: Full=Protein translocase subunit SecA [Halothermothrix orenii H 168]ACL70393.1 preprotein translocase, SecA subunit [Halothermothrix orenii H 168]